MSSASARLAASTRSFASQALAGIARIALTLAQLLLGRPQPLLGLLQRLVGDRFAGGGGRCRVVGGATDRARLASRESLGQPAGEACGPGSAHLLQIVARRLLSAAGTVDLAAGLGIGASERLVLALGIIEATPRLDPLAPQPRLGAQAVDGRRLQFRLPAGGQHLVAGANRVGQRLVGLADGGLGAFPSPGRQTGPLGSLGQRQDPVLQGFEFALAADRGIDLRCAGLLGGQRLLGRGARGGGLGGRGPGGVELGAGLVAVGGKALGPFGGRQHPGSAAGRLQAFAFALPVGRFALAGGGLGASGIPFDEARVRRPRRGQQLLAANRLFGGLALVLAAPFQPGLLLADASGERLVAIDRGLLEQGLAAGAQLAGFPFELVGGLLQGILDALVELGAEQRLQDALPILAAAHQEVAEATLGQHDHLPELATLEAEQFGDAGTDLAPSCGQRPGLLVLALAAEPPQRSLRCLAGVAATATGRADLFGHPFDAVAFGAECELKHHLGQQLGRRMLAAHLATVALAAGTVAEQGETETVEDGGLAGSGRTVDQEEAAVAEAAEVDDLAPRERAEGLHLEQQRLHAASSRSRRISVASTASKAAIRASSGASPISSW